MTKKIMSIVGARPQFVKASMISREIGKISAMEEYLVHTGQHYDNNMSDVFFDELQLVKPSICLDIHGGGHGSMTGRMLSALEQVMLAERPTRVLVYGDTNSTLAGALAAAKLHIPVAHVEAGLRSHNLKMPEEINRVLTDRMSDVLFCPTVQAVKNLGLEGFSNQKCKILQVGDVMQDSALFFSPMSKFPDLKVDIENGFILVTIHRAENTDDISRLTELVQAINTMHEKIAPVVMPLHPRTNIVLKAANLKLQAHQIQPLGFLEMMGLLKRCRLVVTDSGGLQKEAFFFGKPCLTARDETEWVELVEIGANELVGANAPLIVERAAANFGKVICDDDELYGGGNASKRIADILSQVA